MLFAPKTSNAIVQRDQEVFDSFGRRRTVPMRTFMERKGFLLQPKFVFIDGRTGATMYSEGYREEILYNAQQNTPALSSYFELMDRLVPNFLSALSSQKIRGTRVLLELGRVRSSTVKPLQISRLRLYTIPFAQVPIMYAIIQSSGRQVRVTPGRVRDGRRHVGRTGRRS